MEPKEEIEDIEDPAKCVICGTKMLYGVLEEPCWMCGSNECWTTEDGESVCSRPIDDWDLYQDPTGEKTGELMCGYCDESFSEHADSMVVIVNGEKAHYIYKDGILMDLAGATGDGTPFDDLDDKTREIATAIISGTYWQKSDAWRGHSQPPTKADGWVLALDGWHSSMESSDLSEKINDISSGRLPLDYPVILVFGATSNVCSIGLSVYVPRENQNAIEDLLKEVSATPGYAGF